MYYDPDGPLQTASSARLPYRIDFVVGGNSEAAGIPRPEALPLSLLYFCDSCSRVVSRRDLAEDVDSYYCPHCLENMPSSEAMLCGMRCSKCWECPVCSSTLTPCVANPTSREQTYHYACSYCRWSSRGRQEAAQPEQLIAQIVALEREGELRQRMAAIVEAFRFRAQDHQREKELVLRLKRRSSIRGSFSSASLSAFAARRFSSAVSMRSGARLSLSGSLLPGGNPDDIGKKPSAGPWRPEDVEAKLSEQVARSMDLRSEARAARASAPSGDSPGGGAAGDGNNLARDSPTKRPGAGQQAPEVPVLAGLSVQELLRSHREALPATPGKTSSGSLLDELQRSIESDGGGEGACGSDRASLSMRLLQVSYGYQGTVLAARLPPSSEDLRRGNVQLEAPLHHAHAWTLLPVRKPLLTKRSRRCRLLCPPKPDSADASAPSQPLKPCKGLVVRPHINPCANPAFQKNSVALNFVPRCVPWSWAAGSERAGGTATPCSSSSPSSGVRSTPTASSQNVLPALQPGETGELVFSMINPLDSDAEVLLEPQAFNADGKETLLNEAYKGIHWEAVLSEQNVEVLTPTFTTSIAKFNDMSEAHEVFDEEAKKTKELQEQDDRQVIPDRKSNKILVRLRFRKVEQTGEKDTGCGSWAFFVRMKLDFMDASSTKQTVDLIIRFGLAAALSAEQPKQGSVSEGFRFTPFPRQPPT